MEQGINIPCTNHMGCPPHTMGWSPLANEHTGPPPKQDMPKPPLCLLMRHHHHHHSIHGMEPPPPIPALTPRCMSPLGAVMVWMSPALHDTCLPRHTHTHTHDTSAGSAHSGLSAPHLQVHPDHPLPQADLGRAPAPTRSGHASRAPPPPSPAQQLQHPPSVSACSHRRPEGSRTTTPGRRRAPSALRPGQTSPRACWEV